MTEERFKIKASFLARLGSGSASRSIYGPIASWGKTSHIEKSSDDGKTWTKIPIDPQTKFNVIQPSLLVLGDGLLQILCRSRDNSVMQAFSQDNGETWSQIYCLGMFSGSPGSTL